MKEDTGNGKQEERGEREGVVARKMGGKAHSHSMLYDWFDHLVDIRYNPESIHAGVKVYLFVPQFTATASRMCLMLQSPITINNLHILHSLLFQFKEQILSALTVRQDAKEFNSLLDRLGSYANKVLLFQVDFAVALPPRNRFRF